MYLGETKVITVSNPTRVIVGNPAVADVSNIGKKEMNLTPKSIGKTTLVFWDDFGEQPFQVKVYAEDISIVKERIDVLLAKLAYPEVYTEAEAEEGKVFLMGRVKTSQEREKIITAIGDLKNKIVDLLEVREEEAVVAIDVQVLELDRDATSTLGFTWPGSVSLTEVGSPGIQTAGTAWGKLFRVANETRGALTLKLDLLIQQGKARILSRPNLTCRSGKEAELLVGGEKPTFTTSTTEGGSTSSTVTYKEYGIKLKIKPQVTEKDRIKLGLNVEVSEVGTVETLGSSTAPTAKAYPLTKRTVSTELFMDNGQTLAIGGLIKQKNEEDLRKVPFLGDIPLVGLLFRQKLSKQGGGTGERSNTELFITLTPTIIADKSGEKEPPAAKRESRTAEIVSSAVEDPASAYARLVQGRILDKLIYPITAKQAGFQGTVKLSLKLSYQGDLLDLKLKDTSNYRVLDDDALRTAQSA
ncbi:MAG: TonB family protein, partial [Candidatus Omnitrophota bacterium]|nr:TonB family protein [Candidatus Omnitrophota bacterium]